jgi:hypothetical protein
MVLGKSLSDWPTADHHAAISSALSAMLENQHIVTALLQMSESDLPWSVPKSFRFETIIWPFHDGEPTPFDRLALKIRDDLRPGLWGPAQGFKLKFSAIALQLATRIQTLSREEWAYLGFNVASDVDLAILNRLHRDIRSGQTDVKEGIRHALRGSAINPASQWTRWSNNVAETLLEVMVVLNLTVGVAAWVKLGMRDWLTHPIVSTVFFAILPVWLLSIAYAIYAAPGRWWLAILSPAGQFLRRTPYLTSMGPWLNFAAIQLIWLVFSFPIALLTSGNLWRDLVEPIDLLPWDLLFLLLCCWFYKFKVLRVDAPALLLLKHPLGRKAAGLPPEPVTPDQK